MALILLCGFPCVGKTRFANQLKDEILLSFNRKLKGESKSDDANANANANAEEQVKANENTTISPSPQQETEELPTKPENNNNNNNNNSNNNKKNKKKIESQATVVEDDTAFECVIVSEPDRLKFSIDKQTEQTQRGELRSAVMTLLKKKRFVILDASNYVKGFRYELYCCARSLMMAYCVCWIQTNDQLALQWNESRDVNQRYVLENILELRQRFEPPNDKNRWDSPLFRVFNTDQHATTTTTTDVATTTQSETIVATTTMIDNATATTTTSVVPVKKSSWVPKSKAKKSTSTTTSNLDEPTTATAATATTATGTTAEFGALTISGSVIDMQLNPEQRQSFEQGINAIVQHFTNVFAATATTSNSHNAGTVAPTVATISVPHATADLLYELDRITTGIIQHILQHQQQPQHKHELQQQNCTTVIFTEFDRALTLYRLVNWSELQRIQRQYVKACGQMDSRTATTIGSSFIDYLSNQM